MRFFRFVLPASIPAVILVGHAMTACGGSSVSPLSGGTPGGGNNGEDAAGGGGGGGNEGGSPTKNPGTDGSPGTPVDSGITIPDGGFVLPPVEAGSVGSITPGAPGSVACGKTTCDLTANTCCANTDGGTSCAAGTTTSCPQATIHCAQAADCQSGQLCCGVVSLASGTPSVVASCQTGPCPTDQDTPPGAQLCAIGTTECPSGSPCTKQSCEGESLQLCGLFNYTGIVNVSCTAE